MTVRCAECGGSGDSAGHCRVLFERLLALEFSHVEPWGPLHGLTVAVHALQHLDQLAATDPTGWWTSLHVYVAHGFESAARMWAGAPGGSGVAPFTDTPPMAPKPAAFTVTISDVAGPQQDFPASGHVERVDRWARATHAELIGVSA